MSQDPYPRERPTGPGPSYDGGARGYQEYRGYQPLPTPYPFAPQAGEGEKAAQLSLVLGITGFFVAGLILGPLAIWQARRAESLGVPATAGKVLGWILTVLWGSVLLALIVLVVFLFAGFASVNRFGG